MCHYVSFTAGIGKKDLTLPVACARALKANYYCVHLLRADKKAEFFDKWLFCFQAVPSGDKLTPDIVEAVKGVAPEEAAEDRIRNFLLAAAKNILPDTWTTLVKKSNTGLDEMDSGRSWAIAMGIDISKWRVREVEAGYPAHVKESITSSRNSTETSSPLDVHLPIQ